MNTAILLLAAGPSSRMGQSKQLLPIGDESLIRHALKIVDQSGLRPVVIVLGADDEKLRKEIGTTEAELVSNPSWKNGMGGSLKAGIHFINEKFPDTDAVIICVCDQPLMTSQHLKRLQAKHLESGKPIVASQYGESGGVPVFFHKSLFRDLGALYDGQGAKKIILQRPLETAWVGFPEGILDLDTPEDYEAFIRKKK